MRSIWKVAFKQGRPDDLSPNRIFDDCNQLFGCGRSAVGGALNMLRLIVIRRPQIGSQVVECGPRYAPATIRAVVNGAGFDVQA